MKSSTMPSSQQGYAVLFFLFFIGAVALGTYSLYDSGWVASERIRLQNTADNTTYSTVNMVARDMNMMAITNRGMIANQVMVGQLVALSSWSNYVEVFAGRIETVTTLLTPVPYIGPVIARLGDALQRAADVMSGAIDTAAPVMVYSIDRVVNNLISELQAGYHNATYLMAADVYIDVLEKNDPDAEIKSVASVQNAAQFVNMMNSEFERFDEHVVESGAWDELSEAEERENERVAQFAQLVNDSKDGFVGDRSVAFGRYYLPIPGGFMRTSFNLRAGTDFVPTVEGSETRWSWTSMDAGSFNIGYKWCAAVVCTSWSDTELPMGYGAAHALNTELETDNFNYGSHRGRRIDIHEDNDWRNVDYTGARSDRYWRNPFKGGSRSTRRAAQIADSLDSGNNLERIKGIRPFYDFISNDPRNATEAITLIFSKKSESFRLQENIADDFSDGYVSPMLDVDEKGDIPGDGLFAVSSARVAFERPQDVPFASSGTPWAVSWGRRDGLHEHGNLYNPFWEARLVKTDDTIIRAAIVALVDIGD